MSTTTPTRETTAPTNPEVLSPTVRTTTRRAAFWVGAIVVVVILALSTLLLSSSSPDNARLSPVSAHPNGARALIQVLERDGVDVAAPTTLTGAIADVTKNPASTTLVLYDQYSLLTRTRLKQLDTIASNLVLIEPSFSILKTLAPAVSAAGVAPSNATADCDFAPVQQAGRVSGLGRAYRVTSGADSTKCLGSSAGWSLVRVTGAQETVTVFGSTTILTNGSITRAGDAALALGLFGQDAHLVWYLPSLTDLPVQAGTGIPAPSWVPLLAGLAALVGIAAAFWRGRRLGPVVVERLPVLVRASETLEGRARLYQKASARLHSLDALRIGTLDRLATLCGLPRRASVDEIIGAVARATGRHAPELHDLLVAEAPRTDRQLMRLSDGLAQLEREVATATRPS